MIESSSSRKIVDGAWNLLKRQTTDETSGRTSTKGGKRMRTSECSASGSESNSGVLCDEQAERQRHRHRQKGDRETERQKVSTGVRA